MAQQQEFPGIGDPLAGVELAALWLAWGSASLRLTLLTGLSEIDDPFQRAIAVAKLAEAQARSVACCRRAVVISLR